MMWRGISDRARTEGARAIQGIVDGVLNGFARPPAAELYVVRGNDRADIAPSADAATPSTPVTGSDSELAQSLERIAETIDRLAAQLDAADAERADRLDAIDFLLREMVLGGANDRDAIESPSPEISVVADGFPLEVDTAVEVRSRFHDRWICGFAIAEAVESATGPCRYRLTRRSDGIPLPILFDAHDVRVAAAFERQPAD